MRQRGGAAKRPRRARRPAGRGGMTRIGPLAGVFLLLAIAVTFASNHVAARVAFEHGTSVATAVSVRSVCTALAVLLLMRVQGVPVALPPGKRVQALGVGLLLALQSFCLYSAVARIPAALALLAFNVYPMVFALLSWATGGERPARRALIAMPIALVGLALALDIVGSVGAIEGRWHQIGAGVLFALTAAASFSLVLLATTHWLNDVDGRLRTFVFMGVTAVVVTAAGAAAGAFSLPHGVGWLGLALLTLFYGSAITALFVFLPRMGAVNNAVVLNFEPIALLFLGWAILGQAVKPTQIVGIFVVVGALTLVALRRR